MNKEIVISIVIILLVISTLFVSVPFFMLSCGLLCTFILMVMHQSYFLKLLFLLCLIFWAGYITQNLI